MTNKTEIHFHGGGPLDGKIEIHPGFPKVYIYEIQNDFENIYESHYYVCDTDFPGKDTLAAMIHPFPARYVYRGKKSNNDK